MLWIVLFFYRKFLKGNGYSYNVPKIRFGILGGIHKEASRRIISYILSELAKNNHPIYYFDECTFSLNDFKRRYWCRQSGDDFLYFRNPCIMLKLNVVVSWRGVLAFQLTSGRHREDYVTEFLSGAMLLAKSKTHSDESPIVVLDNSQKIARIVYQNKLKIMGFHLSIFRQVHLNKIWPRSTFSRLNASTLTKIHWPVSIKQKMALMRLSKLF